jgi:hypothetical protein
MTLVTKYVCSESCTPIIRTEELRSLVLTVGGGGVVGAIIIIITCEFLRKVLPCIVLCRPSFQVYQVYCFDLHYNLNQHSPPQNG